MCSPDLGMSLPTEATWRPRANPTKNHWLFETRQARNKPLAETQVALARLAVEEGHAADAEASLQKCKEQFHQEQEADDELAASVVLTEALLAQGKHADATKEIEATKSLATQSQNRLARFSLISLALAFSSPPTSATFPGHNWKRF